MHDYLYFKGAKVNFKIYLEEGLYSGATGSTALFNIYA
jgi:hypothetical protein